MAIKDNWILKNLLLAAAFLAVVTIGAALSLRLITRHGKTVVAPDFTNMSIEAAEKLAEENHLSVKVTDSVFVRRLSGGTVYRQLPKAGATVKKGRSIFLTINSIVPRKVVMPNLYGYAVTEARAELQNRGLNLGRMNYVRDIATNNVLGQSCEGKEVHAGDLVIAGSTIDLKVGMNADNRTQVPKVIGMKYVMAVDALHDRFLNVGRVRFDPEIRSFADSVNAVVYRQKEAPGADRTLGTAVDIYLTLDTAKLPAE